MPMDPEFLPEFALLIAGVILGVVAVHLLTTRRWSRALGLGAIGLSVVVLAFVSGRSERRHGTSAKSPRWSDAAKRPLVPATESELDGDAGAASSLSLVLGGAEVLVAASDRYVLSMDGEPFLTLESNASGLLVSCSVAGTAPLAARISENLVLHCAPGVRSERLDSHLLVIKENDADIFRIRYSSPRRIEVTGRFDLSTEAEPRVISFTDGVRWPGAAVSSGMSIDLRPQGRGRLDFERSGLIQVIPE